MLQLSKNAALVSIAVGAFATFQRRPLALLVALLVSFLVSVLVAASSLVTAAAGIQHCIFCHLLLVAARLLAFVMYPTNLLRQFVSVSVVGNERQCSANN
jgi:hypothetical protein